MSEASDASDAQETTEENVDRPGYSPYRLGLGVGIVLTLASLLLFLSFLAIWADRQIFDSDQWTETSTQVIEQPAVQDALANYLVDEIFNNVNVEQEIKDQLPSDWQVLASPAASGLRTLMLSGSKKVLELPVTQQAWASANQVAHQALMTTLEGGKGNVSTQNGTVTVDARAILIEAANKLGLSGKLVNKIPASAGTFVIYQSEDLSTIQNVYKVFNDLKWIFAILTILLYVAAIALAKGRRRRAVIWMGASFVVVGLLVLIAQSLGRAPVVNSLAKTTSLEPAVGDIYDIGTDLLTRMADSIIFTGIAVLLGALFAGPYGWAVSARRFLAPYLRDYLALSAGVAVLAFLILLWIAPVAGFRTSVGLLINTALAIAGFVALVSITKREFPDAEPADFGALGDWFSERWGDVREAARPSEKTTVVSKVAVPEASDDLAELERLQKLHADGALDDAEFAAAKKKLLGG